MALALYRRYRPDTFDGVIGQDQVTVPLSKALDQGKITHAYLFSGPRGCGKTSSARILARCINCEKGPTSHPCGECQSCKDLATGGPGSIDVVEIDAASHNGVDDARELRERAGFAPARDRYKIFILDEAHMVTPQGFNALLKIVEEPPEHVMFIFATTEPDKVIGTIRSRTHHYPFRLVPPEVMGPYLEDICKKENISPAPGVLRLAMRAGAGSMRDTLSVLDQLMVGAVDGAISLDSAVALLGFTPSELIAEAIDAIIEHDGASAYDVVRRVVVGGYDTRKFVEDLLGRVRDLLLMVSAGAKAASDLLNDIAPDDLETLKSQSSKITLRDLARMAQTINDALTGMASAVSPRMNLEILVARLLADSEASEVAANNVIGSNAVKTSAQSHFVASNQTNKTNSASAAVGHFIGAQTSKKVDSANTANNANNANSVNAANNANALNAINADAENAVNTASAPESSASNSKSSDSKDTNEMWNDVVAKLPEDVREYVTDECVPHVQLTQPQAGKQRLILTFSEPMAQHAFALAVCATSPYDGQKVPKVVMSVVHDVFGSQVMIAPSPVAANGERVESVARMDPKNLAKVKRDILLRKTGISAGFGTKADSGSDSSEDSASSESKEEKDSSSFHHTDGSAASVVCNNTADDSYSLQTTNDDAWADMSSVPIADVMPVHDSGLPASSPIPPVAPSHASSTESATEPSSQNLDSAFNAQLQKQKSAAQSTKIQENSNKSTVQVPDTPTSGANADECSMDDESLEAATSISADELKQMFEVKAVEEFSASDPKNPKNAISSAKKKQEE